MQNYSFIILVVVVVVLVIGGILFWTTNRNANVSPLYSSSPSTMSAQASNSVDGIHMGTGTAAIFPAMSDISAVLTTSSAALGTYLIAPNGMTLYKFSADRPAFSVCGGQCTTFWPPYTADSSTLAVTHGASGVLSTITRADGSIQITYKDQPLYFYFRDAKPGDTKGDGVEGTWSVVRP